VQHKLGDRQSDDINGGTDVRDKSLLVKPSCSAPRPKMISLLSMTSTSKWMAIVYYLRVVPWLVPGFSVATHLSQLRRLQAKVDAGGQLTN
jgi:hypothetical protein